MPHFADELINAMESKRSRICVGIDPNPAKFPPEIAPTSNDPRAIIDSFYAFVVGVLDAVAEHAAAVKFQSAYFERYHAEGVEAYYSLVAEAKSKGLVVIGDAKRGDIGSTAEAYAAGHLDPIDTEDVDTPDALTVNPMLGLDTLGPFIAAADRHAKGLFVLVRTSNPGSAALQDAELADGRTWSEALADGLHDLAQKNVGTSGYSNLGAVVGCTQPAAMTSLRRRLPTSIFLLPGYGTQGGTPTTARAAFNTPHDDNHGALISASRSVTYPDRHDNEPWQSAIARAAREMKQAVG